LGANLIYGELKLIKQIWEKDGESKTKAGQTIQIWSGDLERSIGM
jgi:hypothetical protein